MDTVEIEERSETAAVLCDFVLHLQYDTARKQILLIVMMMSGRISENIVRPKVIGNTNNAKSWIG